MADNPSNGSASQHEDNSLDTPERRLNAKRDFSAITQEPGQPPSSYDEHPSKRLKVNEVAEHYNARPNSSRTERQDSPIIDLRGFNNWTKAVLINQYARSQDRVLDICGGKGGDLQKWAKAHIEEWTLVDIAEQSVRDAVVRYKDTRSASRIVATFIAADCCKPGLEKELLALPFEFDVASCQFAMHYAFDKEERARQFLRNVSLKLRPGGYFIGTIPSAGWIVEKLTKAGKGIKSFGNSLYNISVDDEFTLLPPRFGAKYNFFLLDAVGNVPEYLVNTDVLLSLAAEFGLEMEMQTNFMDFYRQNKANPEYRKLLQAMKVANLGRSPSEDVLKLTADAQEVAGLYKVFAFKKKRDVPMPARPELPPNYRRAPQANPEVKVVVD